VPGCTGQSAGRAAPIPDGRPRRHSPERQNELSYCLIMTILRCRLLRVRAGLHGRFLLQNEGMTCVTGFMPGREHSGPCSRVGVAVTARTSGR
jgi:hypothetical protein